MKLTKPKGSTADLREIEYISALHQTGPALRKDGSIRANDISLFLMSRYGIVASPEEVSNSISKGFGGGGISESDGDTMDLTEVVAMLMIPSLVSAQQRRKNKQSAPDDDCHDNGHVADRGSNIVDDFDINSGRSSDTQDADELIRVHKTVTTTGPPRKTTTEDDRNLFQYVLQMILADAIHTTSDSQPPPLKERILNADVFAYCCTSDVDLYNVEWEDKLTSTYVDVFETFRSTKKTERGLPIRRSVEDVERHLEPDDEEGEKEGIVNEVLKKNTFPAIDYAVDTFRSKTYVILIWFTWVLFYVNFIGVSGGTNPEVADLQCGNYEITNAKGFWCGVGQGVINWLKVMFKLVVLGSIFVIGASVGHSTNPHNPLLVVISMGFVVLYTFVPLTQEFEVLPSQDGSSYELSTYKSSDELNIFLVSAQFSVGVMLLLFCLQNILDRSIPVKFLEKYKGLQQVLASGSLFMERNMKQAATFKVNRMIRNALEIHDAAAQETSALGKESAYGRALLTYSKIADATEEIGGYWWMWNGLRTGRLFEEEGIWLSNRVMQGNLGQLFLCLVLIPIIIMMSEEVHGFYELMNSLFEFPLPAMWRIYVPLSVAFLFAEINSLGLVSVYIPSTIRTTLKFRYGSIGSLHDDDFQKMRTQMEQASFIFGSMFWGCFLSNVLVLFVTFSVVSIFCLPSFLPNFLKLVSSIIGLGITIAIKQLFLLLVRSKFSGATFYRASPAVANCVSVLLEAWNLGISVFFVFIRMVTLVITAFIYVARVDIPFLSDSADEVGGMIIDKWPFVFRKDMLQHEAHRHPYLERIGVMYMMKLRYGDRFGSEAGTSWRLLFVYALFHGFASTGVIRGEDDLIPEMKSTAKSSYSVKHLSRLSSNGENDDVETLKEEIKRLKSEVDHLTSCLAEAKTEGNF
eukprot:CCRYP_002307-RC/>CCRYP_002307-RC protein AED:0.22 eAED:0.22 QI:0/0.87/0.82/1/0.81/0.82/17/751/915